MTIVARAVDHIGKQLHRGRTAYYWLLGALILIVGGFLAPVLMWHAWHLFRINVIWKFFPPY